jgi:hypothetical protein
LINNTYQENQKTVSDVSPKYESKAKINFPITIERIDLAEKEDLTS